MADKPLFETYTERNPATVKAVRLTGSNIDAIIEWLREAGMEVERTTFREVSLIVPGVHEGATRAVARGDWMVPEGEGFDVISHEVFCKRFLVTGPAWTR